MLGKNFSLLFYLKKPKKYLRRDMPIYMRITVNGQVKEMTTSRKCDPELWDQKSERAYGKGEYIKELNNHLSTLKVKVFEARLLLIENNKLVTAESIKNMLIGKVEKSKTIAEVFKNHNDQLGALVNSDYSPETLRRYKISLRTYPFFY